MTDYIVIRPAADLPPEFRLGDMDGRWYDLTDIPTGFGVGTAVAVPSGRFEYREDGAVAEVWEIRP